MNDKEKEQIALFRFSIISPVLTGQETNASDYFRRISLKPHTVPFYGRRDYSPKTMYEWLCTYRKFGFEALKPMERSDKNKSRKMTPEVESLILEERAKHPERSCQLFYEQLCARGKLLPSQLSYASVYRYLKRQNLLKTHQRKEGERKRFGYDKINILWQGDTMHGPYIRARGRKTKTYLVAIIDDCSRIIPYATFMIHENATGIARVLKEAIARRGIPKLLYFDNGSPYRNDIIACACAQLGINLVHTPPYTPQAKGKIERFFRTLRERFLPLVHDADQPIHTLEVLNNAFYHWLETDYHRKIHSSIGMSPLDKFLSQISDIRHVQDPGVLDKLFFKREKRKVKHDATISFKNQLYEVSPLLIGKRVEIRYDLDNPTKLYIYDGGKEIEMAHPCMMSENARMKRKKKKEPTPQNDGKEKQHKRDAPANFQNSEKTRKENKKAMKVSFTDVLKAGDQNV